MGAFLFIVVVWSLIAFLYGKISNCGFFAANKKMILGILGAFFDSAGRDAEEKKRMARKAGRSDLEEKFDQQAQFAKSMSQEVNSRKE